MTKEDKYKNLERVNSWVSNCDSKVSYLLTLQGVVLTILFTSSYSSCVLSTFSYKFSLQSFGWASVFRFTEGLFMYAFFVFIFLSLYNTYKTLKARLDPKVYKESGLITNSFLFFDTNAKRTFKDFVEGQDKLTEKELFDDIDSQVFINSKICQIKFKHYNLTLRYCSLGFIIGLIYLILKIKNGS
jgi:hypothetical protein